MGRRLPRTSGRRWALLITLILPLDGVAAAASDAKPDDAVRIDDPTLAVMLIMKTHCDAVVPAFRVEAQPVYDAWRRRHAAAVERVENTEEYRRRLAQTLEAMRGEKPDARRSDAELYEQLCLEHLLPTLAEVPPKRDPRLATPATTWQTFTDALRRADRDAAKACLVGRAKAHVGDAIDRMTAEQLAKMGNTFTRFAVTLELGDLVEATVVRGDGHAGAIHLERTPTGWKIDDI